MDSNPTHQQFSEEMASILNDAVAMRDTVSLAELNQMAMNIRQRIAANPPLQGFIDQSLGADKTEDWVEVILHSMVNVEG